MWEILYNITVMPLQLLIELVYYIMNYNFEEPGIAIICVSIVIQLLVFPMYKRADVIQEKERNKQKEMEHWVKHIKKTFKGDERFMMLQAYYAEQNYKPVYALKGALSLLLQIPFFMAAYNYLSGLADLQGEGFLLIKDLAKPDGLICIAGITINLLPVLMTIFNILSGIIYTKGFTLKEKLQTYLLALLFLVILYKSPSGLVLYWTMNNLFSLLKNIYLKKLKYVKNFKLYILLLFGLSTKLYIHDSYLTNCIIAACLLTTLYVVIRRRTPKKEGMPENKKTKREPRIVTPEELAVSGKIFGYCLVLLTLTFGLLIPLSVVKSSPVEFISASYGPVELVLNVLSIYVGLFLVWFSVIYYMMKDNHKLIFTGLTTILSVCALINFYCFCRNMGRVNTDLVYIDSPIFTSLESRDNIMVLIIAIIIAAILYVNNKTLIRRLYQIAVMSISIIILTQVVGIRRELKTNGVSSSNESSGFEQIIKLSKDGQNVLVIMLDTAVSGFVPFFLEEKPELREMFDGFVYYPNTLSFGGATNMASPALFGGYEYTPIEINKRVDESLEEKHNEALCVMPKFFLDQGYTVTVTNPPYAGYKDVPDLSIYDEFEGINAYNIEGRYRHMVSGDFAKFSEKNQKRSFVYYSIMKASPVCLQKFIYDSGNYLNTDQKTVSNAFLNSYSVLDNLQYLTDIKDDDSNNFIAMTNNLTHGPAILQTPEYIPLPKIDDSQYNELRQYTVDGKTVNLEGLNRLSFYQTNMAALLRLGEWFVFLRENGVYDNTRIIIASDHGTNINLFDFMKYSDELEITKLNPLFMVKDFNAKGFTVSDEFMTNADTCAYAIEGISDNPVNYFTGKPLNNDEKYAHPQRITDSWNWNIKRFHGNTFDLSDKPMYDVWDDIFDSANWIKVEE